MADDACPRYRIAEPVKHRLKPNLSPVNGNPDINTVQKEKDNEISAVL